MVMLKVDLKAVDEKIEKGEALTPEETKEVMSAPPAGMIIGRTEDDEELLKNAVDIDEPKKEDKKKEVKEEIKEPPKVEEKKPAETPPAKETEEAHLDKVYKELDKPEGQEDLSTFSKNEKGLFWEMKRERRARQKAEEERDVLRFDKIKREAAPKEEAKEPVIDVADDDYVSGKQLKEILKAQKPTPVPAPNQMTGMQQRYMAMCDQVARGQYDDYDEVIEAANDILQANPAYGQQLVNAFQKGDNPALVAYHLVKGDPGFNKALPLAKARLEARIPKTVAPKEEAKKEPEAKVEEAKDKEKKIEENSNKTKTSGNFGGGEGGEGTGMTLDDVVHMTDKEFAKIPKAKRDALLKKYGA